MLSLGLAGANAATQNKTHGLGSTTLIISNKEMEDIMKIIKSIKNFGLKFNGDKNKKIFTIQTYESIISGFFCIGFINFMFKGKTLMDFTNTF